MLRKIAIKEYNQGQTVMFPESIDDYIPVASLVRLISHVVDKLDLSEVLESYAGGGCSCYSPRMMLKVLFYGYLNNLYSCRKIATSLTTSYRTGSRLRANESQQTLQTLPTLRQRKNYNGLCHPRYCLQHRKNVE